MELEKIIAGSILAVLAIIFFLFFLKSEYDVYILFVITFFCVGPNGHKYL